MKSSTLLKNKLSAYSALAAAVLAGVSQVKAQVIYTDLNPDVNLNFNDYVLDLNNDGIAEFILDASHVPSASGSYCAIGNYSSFSFSNWNQVNGAQGAFFIYPYVLNSNVEINEQMSWLTPNSFTFSTNNQGILFYKGVFYPHLGYWQGAIDKFLGLRFKLNGDWCYGWVRLDVLSSHHMIIKDYAYNATPNAPILAGEGIPGCADNYEPNNGFNHAAPAVLNADMSALINPAGDEDFFKFDLPQDENNMRVTLTNLPKNYNLFLYDQNYQLIAKSTHHGKINEKIIENNAVVQTYYVKVRANSAATFDADSCYTLKIELSANPFRIDENQNGDNENEIVLYPNPASDKLLISGISEGATITTYDLQGRKQTVELSMSNAITLIDLSSLPNGIYFLEMKSESGTIIKKFVVQK